MPGIGVGGAARAAEAETMHELTHAQVEEAVAATRKKRPLLMRVLLACIPRPKTTESWTNWLSWAATIGIPLWFTAAHAWNADYDPHRAPVWAVPATLCVIWMGFQMVLLASSVQKTTEEIRWRDIVVSVLPLISCVV